MNKEDIKKELSDDDNNIRIINNILKTVRKGSLMIFKSETPNAIVFDVTNIVFDSIKNISEARVWCRHDNGNESYHTYRYDGVSHHSETNDIKEIQN